MMICVEEFNWFLKITRKFNVLNFIYFILKRKMPCHWQIWDHVYSRFLLWKRYSNMLLVWFFEHLHKSDASEWLSVIGKRMVKGSVQEWRRYWYCDITKYSSTCRARGGDVNHFKRAHRPSINFFIFLLIAFIFPLSLTHSTRWFLLIEHMPELSVMT